MCGCKANLITTLTGHFLLGIVSQIFLQHGYNMRAYACLQKLKTQIFSWRSLTKGLFTTRVFTIYSLASCIKCLFPKMKVYLPFPFKAFETKHYILLASLMSYVNLLHLGRSMQFVLLQFPHKCVLSAFSPPKTTSSNLLYYLTMLPTKVFYQPIVILESICTYLAISTLMSNSSNRFTLRNIY